MDKKTIILVVLLGVLLVFWFPLMEQLGFIKPAPEQPADPAIDTTAVISSATDSLKTVETAGTTVDESAEQGQTLESAVPPPPVQELTADSLFISTNKYNIILSTLGGGPVSMMMKDYTLRDDTPINMLPRAVEVTPNVEFAGGTYSTSNKPFSCSIASGSYDVTDSPLEITYSFSDPSGTVINKIYRFYNDDYHYDFKLEIVNPEKLGLSGRYALNWNTPLGVTEPQPEIDYNEMKVVAMMAGSLEILDDFDDDRLKQSIDGYVDWAGVRSKYFTSVIIPRSREGEKVFANGFKEYITLADGDEVEKREVTGGLEMPFVGTVTDSFTVFVGPLDYKEMASYDVELEEILDIGTTPVVGILIKIFAVPILYLMPWMYDYIPNYGLVIILFALLVKFITMPLSAKSFKSMQAMKELQPRMEELKKKHKDKPQQLNAEMMKLYKQHGVNPMSGCLPILPQMPLFFALFAVFRSTILLRDAHFVWFIDDLSRGAASFTDPYMVLVVIMVIAQFFSQKLTMGSNQQNKAIMYIMPLFFGWMFHSFAAGLVLYWTCFSAFSLLDYVFFKRNSLKNTQVKTA